MIPIFAILSYSIEFINMKLIDIAIVFIINNIYTETVRDINNWAKANTGWMEVVMKTFFFSNMLERIERLI